MQKFKISNFLIIAFVKTTVNITHVKFGENKNGGFGWKIPHFTIFPSIFLFVFLPPFFHPNQI